MGSPGILHPIPDDYRNIAVGNSLDMQTRMRFVRGFQQQIHPSEQAQQQGLDDRKVLDAIQLNGVHAVNQEAPLEDQPLLANLVAHARKGYPSIKRVGERQQGGVDQVIHRQVPARRNEQASEQQGKKQLQEHIGAAELDDEKRRILHRQKSEVRDENI